MEQLKWREALPRILADFIVVHISMIGALAASVMYGTARGHGPEAQELIAGFAQHYAGFFWLLSPIFPLVFLLNGFYTHTRGYAGRHKVWIVFRSVVFAVVAFFGVNVILFGSSTVGRSVAVPFAILAGLGLTSIRVLKALLGRHFDLRPKKSDAASDKNPYVLVVGGAGYIGSLLVEGLLEKGYRVRVLDSLLYGDEALRPVKDHPDFELMVGDCRNIQDVVKAVRGVNSIIHLAAIVGDPACDQDSRSALEINYAATRMLIEIAKGHAASRLIFASSCSVYGATEMEMDETAQVQPISLYGQTKVDSERALLDAGSDTFHPIILRFATVFGLGYRPRFDLVVNLLAAKAHREGVITIFNGQQWRPFIHVRDLVEATIRILEAPTRLTGGQVFNVGDKRLNHTLAEVADTVRNAFPHVRVEQVDNADRRNYRVNFDKIANRTGFRARRSLRDGVDELRAALEEGLIADYTDMRYHNQRWLKAAGALGHKDEVDARVMAAFSDHLAKDEREVVGTPAE
jgi:nucleoside-diphosphate-sugar epimerase